MTLLDALWQKQSEDLVLFREIVTQKKKEESKISELWRQRAESVCNRHALLSQFLQGLVGQCCVTVIQLDL